MGNDRYCPGCGFTGRHSSICPCDNPEKRKAWIKGVIDDLRPLAMGFIQTQRELLCDPCQAIPDDKK